MKRIVRMASIGVVAGLLSTPALALKVTNLDSRPHVVAFDVAGSRLTREVAPQATVQFEGLPNGRLSLLSSANPRQGGTVNADGLLSGVIGNGRDQQIPADIMDEYVIWPDGKLQLQRRMKRYGRH